MQGSSKMDNSILKSQTGFMSRTASDPMRRIYHGGNVLLNSLQSWLLALPFGLWFGEDVPLIPLAAQIMEKADIILVIGTSLNVYPAAGLLYNVKYNSRKILIDPNEMQVQNIFNLQHYKEKAGEALPRVVDELIAEFSA